jgi:hypothetical protein
LTRKPLATAIFYIEEMEMIKSGVKGIYKERCKERECKNMNRTSS